MLRFSQARIGELLHHPHDHLVMLSMDNHKGFVAAGERHQLQQAFIVHPVRWVRHEDFNRAMALGDQCRKRFQRFFIGAIDDQVKGIITGGAAFSALVIIRRGLFDMYAGKLGGEADDGCRAATDGRAGARFKRFSVFTAGRADLVDMTMAVDATWNNDLARWPQFLYRQGQYLCQQRQCSRR